MNTKRQIMILSMLLFALLSVVAQQRNGEDVLGKTKERHTRFFNLVADEVRIDSVLPAVSFVMPLTADYEDSIYTASIIYPEFIDMGQSDIADYHRVAGDAPLPFLPSVEQTIVVERRTPSMLFTTTPLAFRDGKYMFLASYMLKVESVAKWDLEGADAKVAKAKAVRRAADSSERYASHSVLANGRWAKIRVAESGIHELTADVIRKAGFSDLNKVKIYGYGGYLQPEVLSADYLIETDDLKETPSCLVNGKRLFFAKGPVYWTSSTGNTRIRNPYSQYGYYFITESDDEVTYADEQLIKDEVVNGFYDNHSLYEVDNYALYHGGRELVDGNAITTGGSRSINIANPTPTVRTNGHFTVSVAAVDKSEFVIAVNDSVVGKMYVSLVSSEYQKANFATTTFSAYNLKETNKVTVTMNSGTTGYINNVCLSIPRVDKAIDLATQEFPKAEYVYNITNQDHHADPQADMVIIIPTSQELREQAERLAKFHITHDDMTVNIVPADELYNEFSSGTPDATAYKRYMKMLYDRAGEDNAPRYLLLFGDGVFDNRMLTSNFRSMNPDNYLLCYESNNSVSEVHCYVSDDFFTFLDDNESIGTEGSSLGFTSQRDVAVGRFPVTKDSEAKIMVDKCINYVDNVNGGKWQNTLALLGDDGDAQIHLQAIDEVATAVEKNYPSYYVKRIMWDTYPIVTSNKGNRYPEVAKAVKNLINEGTLMVTYAGHGSPLQMSHELVLTHSDFIEMQNRNLPLWLTASCDIMPFDAGISNIGETAVLNPKGGAVAFIGTTRTVYAHYNKYLSLQFMNFVLADDSKGRPITIGEALRLTKNSLGLSNDRSDNKLHYHLLGDPALALQRPTQRCVVDSLIVDNVVYKDASKAKVSAGSSVVVSGHVETWHTPKNTYTSPYVDYSSLLATGEKIKGFSGNVSILMRDNLEKIVCFNNLKETIKKSDGSEVLRDPFTFNDRTKILYNGSDSIRNGEFKVSFVIPRDINYSDKSGLITIHAINNQHNLAANGSFEDFTVGGSIEHLNDSIGPSIYCYLNSSSFVNGGTVNTTPYFYAELTDKDGINASGAGIGHDMLLSIDNDKAMTFSLNENFQFDFGTYTSGSTYYNIPELAEGPHKLQFKVWDILNNPSTATLSFYVQKGLMPELADINVTKNPAATNTTFIIQHDHAGSLVDVAIDIFDMSGRLLHTIVEHNVSLSGTYTVDWDLCTDGGSRLQTGVYLYRVRLASEGSADASKAKKLVVINHL